MSQPLWSIANLERNTEDGFVLTAHWRVSLTEFDCTASAYGTQSFNHDPDQTNFIPYDQLTEQQVLQWVWDAMGVDQVVEIQERLAKDIQEQIAPKTQSGVPW